MPKSRQWETTSEADWTLALERESVASPSYSDAIEQTSMRWPLRQRFASARRGRAQRHWPYTPYRSTMNSCKQFDYVEVAAVYGLVPRAQRQDPSVLEGHESVRDLRAKPGSSARFKGQKMSRGGEIRDLRAARHLVSWACHRASRSLNSLS